MGRWAGGANEDVGAATYKYILLFFLVSSFLLFALLLFQLSLFLYQEIGQIFLIVLFSLLLPGMEK